jgi:flagellar hook-associated protein 3 FlgL
MRVTSNTFPNSLVDQLSRLTQRQAQYQNQAATGQKIQRPEDNPTGMQRILDLQTESRLAGQYKSNIQRLQDTASATYGVMRGLKRISDRAGELAILADGTKPPEQLKLYAIEVNNLIRQGVQEANTRFRGDYLLGGTLSNQPPFVLTEDAEGNVTGVTYQGNESIPESEIAEGATVGVQVPGANTGGTGPRGMLADPRYGADFFNHLISLQNHLLAGDTSAIVSTDLPQLRRDEDNLLIQMGNSGAVQARLESALSGARQRGESLEAMVSQEADVDLAEVLVRLNQSQVAYQAALQSGATLLNQSLLDFLR